MPALRSILTVFAATALSLSVAACDKKKESEEEAATRISNMLVEADTRLRNNKTADAERLYLAILEEQPEHAGAIAGLGKLKFESNEFEAAEKLLTKAVEKNAEDGSMWFSLGRARAHQDNHEGAAEAYTKAFELDPENMDAGLSLGRELKKAGKFVDAEPVLRKVAEEDPMAQYVHTELADVLREQGKLDDALKMYMKAQSTYRSDRMARAGAAMVYEAQGDNKHALDEWSAYIRMDCCSDYSKNVARKKMMELEEPGLAEGGGEAEGDQAG